MMKINLISQAQKKEIRLRHLYEVLFRVYIFFGVTAALISIISLSAAKILASDYQKISEEINLANRDVLNYEKGIEGINSRLRAISDVQADFIFWTEILKELSNMANDGLVFKSIGLDKNGREITVKGRAAESVDLLDFKRKIDKSSILKSNDFPIHNLAVGGNIDFTVSLNF